jgi:hypothetical protein
LRKFGWYYVTTVNTYNTAKVNINNKTEMNNKLNHKQLEEIEILISENPAIQFYANWHSRYLSMERYKRRTATIYG